MSIVTKSGDRGETGLLGGKRVSKDDARIQAIGAVDELNAAIGVLQSIGTQEPKNSALEAGVTKNILRQAQDDILEQIQHDLFALGAELANPEQKTHTPGITGAHIQPLEYAIDELEKKLPPLKNFILPTGTPFAAHAHLARAICRRAERDLITLHRAMPLNPHILIYINRLSDLFFMLARNEMFEANQEDLVWSPKTKKPAEKPKP